MLRATVVLASSLLLTASATATDDGLEAPVLTSYTAHAVHRIE